MDFDLLIGIFPQVLLDGLTLGFMYAVIALGYTMVYGVLEFINFAHSEIFIIGAFVGVEILLSFKSAGWLDVLPWVLVLFLVLVAGMAVGTAFTLFFVPAIYLLIAKDRRAEAQEKVAPEPAIGDQLRPAI